MVLNEVPDAVNLAGPDCASWGIPARGSSKRSVLNPMAAQGVKFVDSGNCMISRTLGLIGRIVYAILCRVCFKPRLVALLLVILAKHCIFVVEQPANSLLCKHRRFDWLINKIAFEPWAQYAGIASHAYVAIIKSIAKVYVQRFWMMHHGHGCPKRSVTFSNSPIISGLDLGKLSKEVRERLTTIKPTGALT